MIKSATLDLHCFVSLTNNRMYGDTRIRGPYKKDFKRDIQKIHGGDYDNYIVSEIDVFSLRNFQLNVISPSEPFKPVPLGYRLSEDRKIKKL